MADEIQELKKRAEERAFARKKKLAASSAGKAERHISSIQKFFYQFVRGLHWIWEHVGIHIWRVWKTPFKYVWRKYRILWDWAVNIQDEYGNMQFSKMRAGVVILLTAGFIFIIPSLFGLVFDTAMYMTTGQKNEIVYLTNSQEIDPINNVHSAQGCHSLPCTDDNSIYYRIRGSLFNEIYSVSHGHGLFFADYVAAAIPSFVSKCVITSYGIRVKLFMRGLEVYPDLVHASCTPIGNGHDSIQTIP